MASGSSEPCLCTALRQASRRVSQHYDAALAVTGVSVNQFAILSRLEENGTAAIHTLAARLVMDRSTLGHLLRPLERRGLVLMATSEADRRRRGVRLTEAGAALVAEARPLWRTAQARFETAFGRDEAGALREHLRRACATVPMPSSPASTGS